jgi:hypothetical protein
MKRIARESELFSGAKQEAQKSMRPGMVHNRSLICIRVKLDEY